jgi:uncharacterized protein (DUF2141 family)
MQLRPLFPVLGSLVRHRPRFVGALILLVTTPALLGAGATEGEVTATVTGLRSARGNLIACITQRADAFPDCDKDSKARSLTVPAGATVELRFGPLPNGRYAISLFHDENGNGKLDKRLMIPREGYGFSRDAPVRMGPPSFANAVFAVTGEASHQSIRMRYIF